MDYNNMINFAQKLENTNINLNVLPIKEKTVYANHQVALVNNDFEYKIVNDFRRPQDVINFADKLNSKNVVIFSKKHNNSNEIDLFSLDVFKDCKNLGLLKDRKYG